MDQLGFLCMSLTRMVKFMTVLLEYPVKNLNEEAKKLEQYLWCRRVPPENHEVKRTVMEIEHRLMSAKLQKTDDGKLSSEEVEKVGLN